jgi:hypothetical protein
VITDGKNFAIAKTFKAVNMLKITLIRSSLWLMMPAVHSIARVGEI